MAINLWIHFAMHLAIRLPAVLGLGDCDGFKGGGGGTAPVEVFMSIVL